VITVDNNKPDRKRNIKKYIKIVYRKEQISLNLKASKMWIRSTKTTMWNSESDVWLLRIKNIYPIPRSVGISTANSMELLKLMMFKSDFLSNGKCDDRVPPINLSQLPEFLLCKSQLGKAKRVTTSVLHPYCLLSGS